MPLGDAVLATLEWPTQYRSSPSQRYGPPLAALHWKSWEESCPATTPHTAPVGEQTHRALTGQLTEAVTSLFAERGSCKPLGRALPQQPETES